MEAAGLAVGIVPLVIGALKCYHAVHQYLRVFRHYTIEIKRLFDRLEVQRCILENEVDLILRKARLYGKQTPPVSAAELLVQYDSPSMIQRASSLDDALDKWLGKHVETFKKLFVGIIEQLQELQTELRCFEAVQAEQAKGEPLKQTVLRVKARIKIGFDKRRLQELLDALRNDNEDLRSIASYLVDDSNPFSYRSEVRRMPADILRNRAVILALHESLTTYWTCVDPEHAEHLAKLCLRPVSENYDPQSSEVRMDLAVACLANPSLNAQPCLVSRAMWLYVRTTTEISCVAGASSSNTGRLNLTSPRASGRTLIRHNSVCESLSKCNCNGKGNEACLSFLQPTSGFQHLFYHHETSSLRVQSSACSVSLAEITPEIRTELTMEQQFALARRLALSILELYKSPWLPERWRIHDFSSFAKPSMEDNEFAQMLHVTSTISGCAKPSAAALDPHWALLADPDRPSDTRVFHTMTNTTLFSLGVALLEIAHGKPLEKFRTGTDPNLLCTAHRLVERACPLGERYRELARQCLRCDFGCGAELELRGLQDAVYTDVVGKLDGLMAILRI